MPSTRKRLIVYDLDGTLVDTGEDIAEAANHMLAVLYSSPLPPEEIRRFVGRGLHDLIGRCLKTSDQELIRRGLRVFETYYAAHLTDHSRLYPRAHDVLNYFQDRKQAVLTNKPNPFANDLLVALGISERFTAIIAGNSVAPKKPDPTMLMALMRQEGLGPQDTLLIGDSVIDVATGRNAGVLTVILTHGFEDRQELAAAAPELTVSGFEELLTLARQRGW